MYFPHNLKSIYQKCKKSCRMKNSTINFECTHRVQIEMGELRGEKKWWQIISISKIKTKFTHFIRTHTYSHTHQHFQNLCVEYESTEILYCYKHYKSKMLFTYDAKALIFFCAHNGCLKETILDLNWCIILVYHLSLKKKRQLPPKVQIDCKLFITLRRDCEDEDRFWNKSAFNRRNNNNQKNVHISYIHSPCPQYFQPIPSFCQSNWTQSYWYIQCNTSI